jgi:hypothetical protein
MHCWLVHLTVKGVQTGKLTLHSILQELPAPTFSLHPSMLSRQC